jgi:hypothetical protein
LRCLEDGDESNDGARAFARPAPDLADFRLDDLVAQRDGHPVDPDAYASDARWKHIEWHLRRELISLAESRDMARIDQSQARKRS